MLFKEGQRHGDPLPQGGAPPLVRSWHHGLVSAVAGVNPAFAPAVSMHGSADALERIACIPSVAPLLCFALR